MLLAIGNRKKIAIPPPSAWRLRESWVAVRAPFQEGRRNRSGGNWNARLRTFLRPRFPFLRPCLFPFLSLLCFLFPTEVRQSAVAVLRARAVSSPQRRADRVARRGVARRSGGRHAPRTSTRKRRACASATHGAVDPTRGRARPRGDGPPRHSLAAAGHPNTHGIVPRQVPGTVIKSSLGGILSLGWV